MPTKTKVDSVYLSRKSRRFKTANIKIFVRKFNSHRCKLSSHLYPSGPIKQVVEVIWQKGRIAAAHKWFSGTRQVAYISQL